MKKIYCIIVFTMMVWQAEAAGFRVALQSAKQAGMAHVGAGMSLGPESIFFNPGAVALSEGGISFTGNAVLASTTYNLPGTAVTADLADNVGTPFALYGSYSVSDKLSAGLGVYTPYGNVVEWEDDWAGRGISQSIDLTSIFIQPTLSYQVNEKFGIGAGLIYALGTVELQRGIPNITSVPEPDLLLETDGAESGIGFNAGAFLQATDDLSFGISYRSLIEIDAEGGSITKLNFPDADAVNAIFTATEFNASLPLPAELAIGAAFDVNENLLIAADANLIFWNKYESLDFDFNGNLGGAGVTSSVNPQNWEDAWTLKLGGQYAASEKLDVRAGAYLDYSPVPDENLTPITPDSDRLNFSFGASFRPSDKFTIDGSLLFVNGEERTVLQDESAYQFAQRYKVGATVPSLGLNYSFSK